jgi:hypothetical protein
MDKKLAYAKKDVIDWLLEENNPSVRYFTLRDILKKKESDIAVKAARALIPQSTIIKKIFAKQHPRGYWEDPQSPYIPKYKASYWQIMILGQLGMDRTDKRVSKACEYVFQFQHAEGGFSGDTKKTALREYNWRLRRGKKLPAFKEWMRTKIYEGQMSCLTGNMVAVLIRLGYENDPRVKKALKWLVQVQNNDGGWLCPYWRAHIKDTHSCFMGTICPLDAFSEVSKKNQTKEMKQTIKKGAEFFLMHHLFKADHHNFKIINSAWLKLAFPYFFYNIVRGLDILTKLGYAHDERLNDAVKVLLQKCKKDGTWRLENAPVGRMHVNFETIGKPSKWLTLIAYRILKNVQRQ